MLTLVLGRAGSGKTSYAMNQFKTRMDHGATNLFFIVPEQYSHDAERHLLRICGDHLSLHGEVLSFSRLCSRVFAETGGMAAKLLDNGGRLLVMSRTVDALASKLKVYGKTESKANYLQQLTAISKELKSACVTPTALELAAEGAYSPLKEKLQDLALITSAYEAFFNKETANPDDRLTRLVRVLEDSSLFTDATVYIDGFTDFTAQEMRVVEKLMDLDVSLTVCLTCNNIAHEPKSDELSGDEELFEPSLRTALQLKRLAEEHGKVTEIVGMQTKKQTTAPALQYLERNLFLYHETHYEGDSSAIELYRASTPSTECENAAAKVLELVRSGYRYHDIAVSICDFEAYGSLVENIFEKYDIPVYINKKTNINLKPPVALIEYVLDIISSGWDRDSVFRYLKTGMTGLAPMSCGMLENYVLQWNLRGAIWTRDEDWVLPPSGYERDFSGTDEEKLRQINMLRRTVVKPIVAFQKALRRADSFGEKLRALYSFLLDIRLPETIEEKAALLTESGELQRGDEYKQLWSIIVHAMDQFYDILGDCPGSNTELLRLWKLLISQYDIGTIPISLDRVGLGPLSRLRRKDIKCMIVIGASDDTLPKSGGQGGVFSAEERTTLVKLGLPLTGTAEDHLNRELNTIYASLTLPDEKLIISYAQTGAGGGEKRPSFVIKRLKTLYSMAEQAVEDTVIRCAAPGPCFELAASALSVPDNTMVAAAYEYVKTNHNMADKLRRIQQSAALSRGGLSLKDAECLYGKELVMSASRVDKFYACRYAYFLQYGLNAKPRRPAGFDAPTAGTFMHYILEHVTKEIEDSGGFAEVTEAQCRALTDKYAAAYVDSVLQQFKDKSNRFRYLFNRLVDDAVLIVLDMVEELKNSDFVPVDFELAFSENGDIPPRVLDSETMRLKVKGFVDRVDGWEHDGKLYLRVVDYKTGKKAFSLSDVCYGMNMQMLIYLFTLQKNGFIKYGKEIVPAAVLYAPARDEIVPASRNADDEEIYQLRLKKLRRSGLLLNDSCVIEAMEHGAEKRFLPVKSSKDGLPVGDSLAGLEQLGKLSSHIDRMLLEIGGGVKTGSIAAEPFYKNDMENACRYCDFKAACRFSEADGDKRRYQRKLNADDAWAQIEKGVAQ